MGATDSQLLKVGDIVYCNAFADARTPENQFLCEVVITRLPTKDSKVYKVIVIKIGSRDQASLHAGKGLLGRKIPKPFAGLVITPSTRYSAQYEYWMELGTEALSKIYRTLPH